MSERADDTTPRFDVTDDERERALLVRIRSMAGGSYPFTYVSGADDSSFTIASEAEASTMAQWFRDRAKDQRHATNE